MKKTKITAYLDAALFDELDALATQRRVPKTQVIEAALASNKAKRLSFAGLTV